MRFGEVVEALSSGKPVRRSAWDEDYFIYYGKHFGEFIEEYNSDDYGKTSANIPINAIDFLADDWEILEWERPLD